MNLNSFSAPPVNNALQPDIYNKLDAEVIERTRVANNQLAMRLLLEEKIINKYRNEAERIILLEKTRVAKDLNRISQTLPAMARIRDFDEQFFPRGTDRPTSHLKFKRKKKNYLAEKNDDVICHRCYIHHMPLKKKFYTKVSPPSSPTVLDASRGESKDATDAEPPVRTSESGLVSSSARTKSAKSNIDMDVFDSYGILDRSLYGQDLDSNETPTPRLMPNEQWKKIVKNVCSQCLKREKTLAAKMDRSGYSRERTVGFDRSVSTANKSSSDSMTPTRSLSHASRGSSQRQSKIRSELRVMSSDSSVLKKIPGPDGKEEPIKGTRKQSTRDASLTELSDTLVSVKDSKKTTFHSEGRKL
ncbi:hypothetical protein Bpfe_010644 [Biomphalaria pfeifferi]|uniref:Uncharacterized protein n=1 Tax=Biomphalaria pfeifferi TaxID=112525 RepID=A0AAD8BSB3_BIOPF|nr:hypothetical protein Bpfe_010644 [Biomphalaria pfeifferi]